MDDERTRITATEVRLIQEVDPHQCLSDEHRAVIERRVKEAMNAHMVDDLEKMIQAGIARPQPVTPDGWGEF